MQISANYKILFVLISKVQKKVNLNIIKIILGAKCISKECWIKKYSNKILDRVRQIFVPKKIITIQV